MVKRFIYYEIDGSVLKLSVTAPLEPVVFIACGIKNVISVSKMKAVQSIHSQDTL